MSSRLMDILHPTKNSIFLIWGLTSDTLSPNPRGEGRLTQSFTAAGLSGIYTRFPINHRPLDTDSEPFWGAKINKY